MHGWPVCHAQLRKLQGEAEAYKASTRELQQGLDSLSAAAASGNVAALQADYVDTVRRMAVVQVRLPMPSNGRPRGVGVGAAASAAFHMIPVNSLSCKARRPPVPPPAPLRRSSMRAWRVSCRQACLTRRPCRKEWRSWRRRWAPDLGAALAVRLCFDGVDPPYARLNSYEARKKAPVLRFWLLRHSQLAMGVHACAGQAV